MGWGDLDGGLGNFSDKPRTPVRRSIAPKLKAKQEFENSISSKVAALDTTVSSWDGIYEDLEDDIEDTKETLYTGKTSKKRKGKWKYLVLFLIVVLALVGGVYYLYQGAVVGDAEEEMPLPKENHMAKMENPDAPETLPLVGPDGKTAVEVRNADTGDGDRGWRTSRYTTPITSMSVDQMAPNSVFIPAQGIYFESRIDSHFGASHYSKFYSLRIPDNPHRGVVYGDGAPLVGGWQGTTLVGSHVSYGRWVRGALYEMSQVKQGYAVWTKDANGKVWEWRVTDLWYADHKQFPNAYFSKEGPRQLVLVTCGGRMNRYGYYRQNVFLVAKPVNPEHIALRKELAELQRQGRTDEIDQLINSYNKSQSPEISEKPKEDAVENKQG